MTARLVLTAILITLGPTLASAACMHDDTKSSTTALCAQGQTWDSVSQSCVDASA